MLKRLSKLFIVAAIAIMAVSCEAEQINSSNLSNDNPNLSKSNASEEFAKILSKAIYEERTLRNFIRDESLKEFDKDYDVFYPWVQNQTVNGKETFREVLSKYDEIGLLPDIERTLPLLTILVPDWSWVNDFSAYSWDTESQDISVVYKDSDDHEEVYQNGSNICTLETNQIPGFPCIIVKENERIKRVSTLTKAGVAAKYEFIDDEFNASLSPCTKGVDHDYYDRTFETEDYSNFISHSEMSSRSNVSITAFNVFANNPYASHRDNIYYGMTDDVQQGKLNNRISEYIAKIRLGTINSEFILEDGDFTDCPESYTRYVAIDDEVLINKFYYEGNLELYFHIFIGDNSGSVTELNKYKSVSFNDVFQLSKVHVDFKHKTWISDRKWVYTVDYSCFVPKWFDANIQLPKWDISSQSTVINIKVSEYDSEKEVSTSENIVTSHTNNFTAEGSGTVTGKVGNSSASGSIKLGYGTTSKNESTITVTTKTKDESDDLGTALLYYTDPIILSSDSLDGVSGYRVKEIGTGFVYMLILPKYE